MQIALKLQTQALHRPSRVAPRVRCRLVHESLHPWSALHLASCLRAMAWAAFLFRVALRCDISHALDSPMHHRFQLQSNRCSLP